MQLFLFLFGLILSQGVIGAPAPVNDSALHDMGSGRAHRKAAKTSVELGKNNVMTL
ncbi:hypothetical protein PSHT_13010 [Puccinia striiformis]|uniref:Uncharacterized protein n=1 Tax=Puccinia striiformis TaxID=27350 RepID=A0A2S4UT73_9BASI|nr:hypothetical protein PSHT_13010 [Puccinia striiformis]